jgi:hypothetical protein
MISVFHLKDACVSHLQVRRVRRKLFIQEWLMVETVSSRYLTVTADKICEE